MVRPRGDEAPIGASEEPDLASADPVEIDAEELARERELEGVALAPAALDDADLRGLRLVDLSAERLSAASGDWRGASLLRAELREARLTGLDLGEARLREVRFRGCKLDYVNFRHAELEYVSFEDCVLAHADFQGSRLDSVRFAGCQLGAADFTKATLSRVDLRGSDLAGLGGSLLNLSGAVVDSPQLIDLAPQLATELGIRVEERQPPSPDR
ncbi:MAG: pentapeptide repeat-containing protein [Solirubrobacterales bacterium]